MGNLSRRIGARIGAHSHPLSLLALALLVASCSDDDDTTFANTGGSGGEAALGGASPSGGLPASGGQRAGGAAGWESSGGTSAGGGSSGAGTAGSAGTSRGGTVGSGGIALTGGTPANGGAPVATGGATVITTGGTNGGTGGLTTVAGGAAAGGGAPASGGAATAGAGGASDSGGSEGVAGAGGASGEAGAGASGEAGTAGQGGAGGSGFCVPGTVHNATEDFALGWPSGLNPNGLWQYGWTQDLDGTLTLFPTHEVRSGQNGLLQIWYDPANNLGNTPSVSHNPGEAYDDGNVAWSAGAMMLHPCGQDGHSYAHAIFTVPLAGTYALDGSFFGQQRAISVDVHVLVNGVAVHDDVLTTLEENGSFAHTLSLSAGDHVDFAVGPNGDFAPHAGTTGLDARFTCTGEPSTESHRSCKDYLDQGQSVGDGRYRIDPDGSGPLAPFQVYCDMTTDGGGWTLVYRATNHANTIENGMVRPGAIGSPPFSADSVGHYKLTDFSINRLRSRAVTNDLRVVIRQPGFTQWMGSSFHPSLCDFQALPPRDPSHVCNRSTRGGPAATDYLQSGHRGALARWYVDSDLGYLWGGGIEFGTHIGPVPGGSTGSQPPTYCTYYDSRSCSVDSAFEIWAY
jgi:hypothetical protein